MLIFQLGQLSRAIYHQNNVRLPHSTGWLAGWLHSVGVAFAVQMTVLQSNLNISTTKPTVSSAILQRSASCAWRKPTHLHSPRDGAVVAALALHVLTEAAWLSTVAGWS